MPKNLMPSMRGVSLEVLRRSLCKNASGSSQRLAVELNPPLPTPTPHPRPKKKKSNAKIFNMVSELK